MNIYVIIEILLKGAKLKMNIIYQKMKKNKTLTCL